MPVIAYFVLAMPQGLRSHPSCMTAPGKLWSHEILPVGTHRKIVHIEHWARVLVQWFQYTALGAATVNLYTTSEKGAAISVEDPALNPAWQAGAPFATQPTAALGSDYASLNNPGFTYLLVEVVVATELRNFSLVARAKDRI